MEREKKEKKLLWEVESEYLVAVDNAMGKLYYGDNNTLKDFLDIGFNSTIIQNEENENVYWKDPDGTYQDYDGDISEEILSKKVSYVMIDTDGDGYKQLIVEEVKD